MARRRADADGRRLLPPGRGAGRAAQAPWPTHPPHDPDERHPADRRMVRAARSHTTSSSASRSTARPSMHDRVPCRQAGRTRPSSECSRGLELLQAHDVDWNILCTVNAANQDASSRGVPLLPRRPRASLIQFIPIVERENETGFQEGNTVTDRSVDPEAWGRFLSTVFDEWVRTRRRHACSCRTSTPRSRRGSARRPPLCIFGETCGNALALEHNGDLYSCDHFVEPDYLLGNITDDPHGRARRPRPSSAPSAMPSATRCRSTAASCDVRFACNGECPKNRFIADARRRGRASTTCAPATRRSSTTSTA